MDTPGLHAGYTAVLRDFRLEFSRGGAYTGIVLILLGMGLDSALYPDKQSAFTSARIVVSVLIFSSCWPCARAGRKTASRD